ncbi:hypothetical protein BH09PLA1_BH09PLA1_25870 [soil metagenome]
MTARVLATLPDPGTIYPGLVTTLKCASCAWESGTIVPPESCPKCGTYSFQRIEVYASRRATERVDEPFDESTRQIELKPYAPQRRAGRD